jgi:hypothetical protein
MKYPQGSETSNYRIALITILVRRSGEEFIFGYLE